MRTQENNPQMEIDNEALLQHAIKVTEKAREVAQTRRDWEFMDMSSRRWSRRVATSIPASTYRSIAVLDFALSIVQCPK